MIPTDVKTHSILGRSSLAAVRTGVSYWAVIEMLGLQVAKHSVPAWSNKLTESTVEQFPVLVPQDVSHDFLLPGSCGVCNKELGSIFCRKR